jgi:O-antigen ligase
MEIIAIGVAVAFNCLVIYLKFNLKRWLDGLLDLTLLVTLSLLFSGTYTGLAVATIASAIISIVLFIRPPKIKLPKPP